MKAKIYNFFVLFGSLAVVYCLFSIFFSFEVIEAKKAALVARAAFLHVWNFIFPKLLLWHPGDILKPPLTQICMEKWRPQILTLFYMGGGRIFPPDWLSLSNRRWMLQMGWFFMTLFLPILERSWRGHVWKLFWKFQKFLRRQFFQNSIQRGDHSMQKSESRKSLIFLFQILFFLPNMNYKCSKL